MTSRTTRRRPLPWGGDAATATPSSSLDPQPDIARTASSRAWARRWARAREGGTARPVLEETAQGSSEVGGRKFAGARSPLDAGHMRRRLHVPAAALAIALAARPVVAQEAGVQADGSGGAVRATASGS